MERLSESLSRRSWRYCEAMVLSERIEVDPGVRTTGAESLSGFGSRRNGSAEAVVDFPGRAEIQ